MNNPLKMMIYVKKKKFKKWAIKQLMSEGFYMRHKGYCPCCDEEVFFESESSWLRDYLLCSNCGSIPRERALMVVIEKYYPNWRELSIHESSPGHRGTSLKLRNQCNDYIASQYFPNEELGSTIKGWLNQDLEQQTFKDQSFDLVITQDVMEHVYDPAQAFSEIARTLKKGGAHIFTVPLVNKHQKSEIWAKKGVNGETVFLHDPEWHGNVVDPSGSPVTMHWGFDIVNFIESESKLKTTIEHIDNLDYGIRAELIEVLVSRK